MTLHQKVELLSGELNLTSGGSLAERVNLAVREVGVDSDAALTLIQKVDACLETMGHPLATVGDASMVAHAGVWQPPPIGFGASYESYMFGDFGYGSMGGMPYRSSYGGYSRYDRFGSGYDGIAIGGWGYGGWGGYGYLSPWDVSYGGQSGFGGYGGYMIGPGGSGSWGANGGYGGLRRGSAAERAIGRAATAVSERAIAGGKW